MKAHVQILSGIVRVGPTMEKFGAEGPAGDFEVSAAFASTDNKTAVLMACAMEREGQKLTRAHMDAAIEAVEFITGFKADWFRKRHLKP